MQGQLQINPTHNETSSETWKMSGSMFLLKEDQWNCLDVCSDPTVDLMRFHSYNQQFKIYLVYLYHKQRMVLFILLQLIEDL